MLARSSAGMGSAQGVSLTLVTSGVNGVEPCTVASHRAARLLPLYPLPLWDLLRGCRSCDKRSQWGGTMYGGVSQSCKALASVPPPPMGSAQGVSLL
jgi:hypothetical protein